jgi:hypothetical protein
MMASGRGANNTPSSQVFACQTVKGGEEADADEQRQGKGDEGDQQGFAGELCEELAPERTQDFTDADLADAGGGLSDGEVRIIETGDDQDQECNSGEHIHGDDTAIRGEAIQ